jgi:hypothetical protein
MATRGHERTPGVNLMPQSAIAAANSAGSRIAGNGRRLGEFSLLLDRVSWPGARYAFQRLGPAVGELDP